MFFQFSHFWVYSWLLQINKSSILIALIYDIHYNISKKFVSDGTVNNIPPGAIILPLNDGDMEHVAVINGNSELPGSIVNPWSTYKFNWSQVEQLIINRLLTGDRICRIRKLLVRQIILQMPDICTKIPIRVLRNVAKKIVEAYPDSLEDRLRGKKYSKGFMTFLDALRVHNNYLNRPETTSFQ